MLLDCVEEGSLSVAAGEHEGDLAAAVSQIAEMALLGAGHAAHMFPESLDEFNDAHGGETQWRVVL